MHIPAQQPRLELPSALDRLHAGRDVSWRFDAASAPGPARTAHRELPELLRVAVLMSRTDVCGGARILLEHADRMTARGHSVTVVSHFPAPDWFDLQSRFVQVPTGSRLVDRAPVVDLLVCGYWDLVPEAAAAQLAPVVHFEQGDFHLFEDIAPEVRARVERCLDLADAHTVVSSTVATVLQERYGVSASVVPNAVDPAVFHPGSALPPTGRRSVLCVGWDGNAFKGVDDVRRVARALRTSHPDVDVVWVTPSAPQGPHEEFARVVVAPTRAELAELYRRASAYVCASHYESFPLPPMESMASGTPVVTTANTGSLEYCRHEENSLVVPVRDASALHHALTRVLDDPDLAAALVSGGLATAASYTWDAVMDTALAAYRSCAQEGAAPVSEDAWVREPVGSPETEEARERLEAVLSRSGAARVWVPVREAAFGGQDAYRWQVAARRADGEGDCRTLAPHHLAGRDAEAPWAAARDLLSAGRPAEALVALEEVSRWARDTETGVAVARWVALCQIEAGEPAAALEVTAGLAGAFADDPDLLALAAVAAVRVGLHVDLARVEELIAVSGPGSRYGEYFADPAAVVRALSPELGRPVRAAEPEPSARVPVARSGGAPRVSVIMPVRDGERFIEAAARSILSQTHADLELLVVDDRSTDASVEVVRSLGDPRVRVLPSTGAGEGAARNTGLDAARGEWVVWQDSDDVALPHRVASLLAAVSGGADFAHSDMMFIDAQDRPTGYLKSSSVAARAVLPHLLREGTPFNNPSMLLRRSAVGSLRFDPSLVIGVDTDFVRRFAPRHAGVHVPEPLTLYRRHERNLTAGIGREADYPHVERMLEDERLEALVPEAFTAHPGGVAPAVARAVVGLALHRRGYQAALTWFQHASTSPLDADAALVVGGVFDLAMRQDASAAERFTAASPSGLSLALAGDAHAALGDAAGAAELYRRSLVLDPEGYDAVCGLRALGEELGLRVVDEPARRLLRR